MKNNKNNITYNTNSYHTLDEITICILYVQKKYWKIIIITII